jgi:hypothetical protein
MRRRGWPWCRSGERIRDLDNDRCSPDIRAERTRSSGDGHENEVRLTRLAAQEQRTRDPWCSAGASRTGENRLEPGGKRGCCGTSP